MTLIEVNGFLRNPLTTAGDLIVEGTTGPERAALTSQLARNVSLSPYAAVGDGVADDSVIVQAAIDAAASAAGGVVAFPSGKTFRLNIIGKSGVTLRGGSGRFGYLPGSVNQTKFLAAGTGAVVDTPVTTITGFGIENINIQGLGSGTAAKGIRFRDNDWGFVKGVQINNFADEGLLIDSTSGACIIEDVFTTNCVLNRTRGAVIGAVDISGADHYLHRVEAGISGTIEGTVQSVNLYCVAIAYRGSNGWITDCNGELSDVGVYISGSRNRFTGVRADLNYGHGWMNAGLGNQIANGFGLNNSQDTTNTYSNFHATAASGGNLYSNCLTSDINAKKAKYGFEDLVSSATTKNQYVNCLSTTAVTAQYLNQTSAGSSFVFPAGTIKTLTADSTTPDVTGYERFFTANTVPTTITNFTGSVAGQRIDIFCNDANTTIQHNGATITLDGAGNLKLRNGETYVFSKMGSVWREVSSGLPLGVTADVGNAAKSLQARVDKEDQVWDTPLTADRAVTLSATGAFEGAYFHITRTGNATGAFNLNVGTGPLKALAVSTWCIVKHNGTAWYVAAYGGL